MLLIAIDINQNLNIDKLLGKHWQPAKAKDVLDNSHEVTALCSQY